MHIIYTNTHEVHKARHMTHVTLVIVIHIMPLSLYWVLFFNRYSKISVNFPMSSFESYSFSSYMIS